MKLVLLLFRIVSQVDSPKCFAVGIYTQFSCSLNIEAFLAKFNYSSGLTPCPCNNGSNFSTFRGDFLRFSSLIQSMVVLYRNIY